MTSLDMVAKHLTNESGYTFMVRRPSDEKIVGGYFRVETAVRSVEMGWQCELEWHLVPGDDSALDARCMATRKHVARLHKIPMGTIPLALIL